SWRVAEAEHQRPAVAVQPRVSDELQQRSVARSTQERLACPLSAVDDARIRIEPGDRMCFSIAFREGGGGLAHGGGAEDDHLVAARALLRPRRAFEKQRRARSNDRGPRLDEIASVQAVV